MEIININKEGKTNLYIQLYRQLKKAILENKLKANTKLKPIRQMADDLGINPATVVKAYNLLEMEELIYKKVGSGSYVSPVMERYPVNRKSPEERNDLDMMEYGQILVESDINFASATLSPELLPVDDFQRIINTVIDRDGGEAFVYQKSQGYYPLREAIYSNILREGINSSVNNILIVSGAQQALDLLAKVLVNFTDTVVVEEPTYSAVLSAFRSRGAKIKAIPLLSKGMDLEELEQFLKSNDIACVYVMTSFHNPTGISWRDEKKDELLKLAERYDFYIIEDDCLSELYYTGDKPLPLKNFDLNNRVIYIKSYSKLFMPGLRLGFMVAPNKIITSLLSAKYFTDISSPGLTQRVFDLYIREGLWQEHLKQVRSLFNRRFHIMKEKIRYFHPDISLIHGPRGGLYFWLSLPEGLNSDTFYFMAIKNGASFLPGRVFFVEEKPNPFFRLSFAGVNEKEIKKGMDILIDLARRYIEEGDGNRDYLPVL